MPSINERLPLKKYFYGSASWLNLIIFLSLPTMFFIPPLGVLIFIGCLIAKFAMMFKNPAAEESLYDRILKQDVEYLKRRSVDVMGLVDEDLSLIDPIVAIGYASDDSVKTGEALVAEKKNLLQVIIASIKDLILSIPRAIYSFVMSLMGRDQAVSRAIFFEGNEGKIRGSLVSFCIISFTDEQVVSYNCSFDIALGIILEEYAREIFYRDIDSVSFGTKTMHVTLTNGSVTRSPEVDLCLAVASEKNIVATISGGIDIIRNEFMAMKALIRTKKES